MEDPWIREVTLDIGNEPLAAINITSIGAGMSDIWRGKENVIKFMGMTFRRISSDNTYLTIVQQGIQSMDDFKLRIANMRHFLIQQGCDVTVSTARKFFDLRGIKRPLRNITLRSFGITLLNRG